MFLSVAGYSDLQAGPSTAMGNRSVAMVMDKDFMLAAEQELNLATIVKEVIISTPSLKSACFFTVSLHSILLFYLLNRSSISY